jgi:tRNA(Arg) A34 adenosine deaminase TadA
MNSEDEHMDEAIGLALASIASGGGPFGAVVVREGVIVGRGNNRVVEQQDPTAHAEVVAIRDACQRLGTHVLQDCVLYTSCEPCPMCMAAVYWARIPTVVYGADREMAAAADFDDSLIYRELAQPLERRKVAMRQQNADAAALVFTAWKSKEDRTPY